MSLDKLILKDKDFMRCALRGNLNEFMNKYRLPRERAIQYHEIAVLQYGKEGEVLYLRK